MASINRPKPKATFHEGQPNAVLSVAPVKMVIAKFTGSDCKEEIALCLVFGTNNEDGGTGVWVMANQEELMKTLRVANKHVRRGSRAELALDNDPSADDLPESLGEVAIESTEPMVEEGSALDTLNL